MSFITKLKLEGEEMNVLQCAFRLNRAIDSTGKPISYPQGGVIKLLVESTENNDLFSWMIAPMQKKSGIITFYRRDSMSKLKTLKFTDGYCVDYYETYDHVGENPMQIQIMVSAREITLNEATITNAWPQ